MSKKLQLSIPKPCHENWDAMTPVEKGKFCGSCQKQVVDFSNMSDRQIAEFFKKPSTGSVCGRFMTDQLERDIEIPKKRIPWVKYFFQFTLPAFLVSLKASAEKTQGKIKLNETVSDTTRKPVYDRPTMGIIARPIYDEPQEKGITGRVLDAETGKPLSETLVTMTSTIGKENIKVKEDGFFVLDIYRKITVKKIEFSCPGYVKTQMTLQEFMKISGENRPVFMERQIVSGNLRVQPVCTKPLMGDTIRFDTIDRSVKGEIQLVNDKGNIQGTVVNEKGNPVPYASIQAGNVMSFYIADENGFFRINSNEIPGNKILNVSSAGFENAIAVIEKKNEMGEKMIIVMKAKDMLPEVVVTNSPLISCTRYSLGGMVAVKVSSSEQVKEKSEIEIKSFEEKFKVYPNPVTSGFVNLAFSKLEQGYYELQIITLSAQQVLQKEIWIDAEARLLNMDIPAVAAGSYYLILTNKKSGKKFSEKLLIQ